MITSWSTIFGNLLYLRVYISYYR